MTFFVQCKLVLSQSVKTHLLHFDNYKYLNIECNNRFFGRTSTIKNF